MSVLNIKDYIYRELSLDEQKIALDFIGYLEENNMIFLKDNCVKELAWKYVDRCGHCGSCSGGRSKVVFGKEFNDICGCTIRVDNPTYEDLFSKY